MTRPAQPERLDHPPACRPTMDRVQAVLDGALSPDVLAADHHPAACPTCRERVRAARVLLAALADPVEPVTVPIRLTDSILAGVWVDRRGRARRRVFAYVGGFAAAAAVLVAVWLWSSQPGPIQPGDPPPPELVEQFPAPTPADQPHAPPPRLADELARAGDALRDASRAITEPAAAAPKLFTTLTDPLLNVPPPPMGAELEPARRSLAELPDAAKAGLEPVTGTAQKAFTRLLHDVGAMQPKAGS